MLLRDSAGRSVEFHLFASSGVDFAEDWLDAGSLSRDAGMSDKLITSV